MMTLDHFWRVLGIWYTLTHEYCTRPFNFREIKLSDLGARERTSEQLRDEYFESLLSV